MDLLDYNSALIDVQAALKENLKETYKGEAYKRMGICYKAIDDKNRAGVAFSIAQKLLQTDLKPVMDKVYKQVDEDIKKGKLFEFIYNYVHDKTDFVGE